MQEETEPKKEVPEGSVGTFAVRLPWPFLDMAVPHNMSS